MNTTKIKKNQTLMIAHRGLSGLEPENSIPAFVAAGNRSYFGVETDVHVTADGKFVIIHDDTTKRVAGDNICIEESSHELIRKIVLNNISRLERAAGIEKKNLKSRTDLIIPNLEDYITICQKYEKVCVLELKNQFVPEDIARMVEEIRETGYLDNVIFISFNLQNLIELRKLLPEQRLQYLTEAYNEEILAAMDQYQLDYDVDDLILTQEIIDEVHAHGHKVNCWTVDKPEQGERLAAMGVDFITTNCLE